MIPHDVELCDAGPPVTFDPVGVEGERVSKLVPQRQGEVQVALLAEAVQHVEHGAAGRLVRLQEHKVCVRPAGAQRHVRRRQRERGTGTLRLDAGGRHGGNRGEQGGEGSLVRAVPA